MPWYWIVDRDARAVEVYGLEAGRDVLSKRLTGEEPLDAEPFPALALAPAALWV